MIRITPEKVHRRAFSKVAKAGYSLWENSTFAEVSYQIVLYFPDVKTTNSSSRSVESYVDERIACGIVTGTNHLGKKIKGLSLHAGLCISPEALILIREDVSTEMLLTHNHGLARRIGSFLAEQEAEIDRLKNVRSFFGRMINDPPNEYVEAIAQHWRELGINTYMRCCL